MKIRELIGHWEQNAKGRLTRSSYQVHLDLESAARLAALSEMYPKRNVDELLSELVSSALEELETSLPYVKGSQVVATDEMGDPLYEDIGPTPRFLALSRKYLHQLTKQQDATTH
ncbi:pilin assembly protein [Pseudomonas sp. UL073]|uniref:Pilin assembly protein n=1 Tax=Zestomonas insulae TaxID=2809017 RepID=A0ABS2IAS3_9GAMM|nr:pilin assembly protein [Pseudomonas insulae]MBM7059895.1 pilin assembly protein [Pseudomonas insulae]